MHKLHPRDKASAPTRHIVFRAFRISRDEDQRLKARAAALGVSVSELIRKRLTRDLRCDAKQAA